MAEGRRTAIALGLITLIVTTENHFVSVAEGSEEPGLQQIRSELQQLENNAKSERERAEHDERLIHELEQRLHQMETENAELRDAGRSGAVVDAHAEGNTQQQPPVGQPLASRIPAADFDRAMGRYLGTHQFTLVGAAAGDFGYDRNTKNNTFSAAFEPLVLYRLNDWILFEGTIQALLPAGSKADFELPVATAQIFLNDYMELNAGIFDQPFGDWLEDQSPIWVNRFITAPLLYGAESVIPPTDIGVQLRGAAQWGALGQDVDYTIWAANGPSFDSSLPTPVVGQTLNGQNNIAVNSNGGRALGARLRVYPFSLDSGLGRLELGASTYDGKWQSNHRFDSWGVDFAYLKGNLQARGEFVESYRQLPGGAPNDDRQGWYVQAGYFLQGIPRSGLGDPFDGFIRRLEPLIRYSGVNQRAVVADEISTDPGLGLNGSASVFAPHARELAFGLDYWIEPSIVWQTEFDLEMPQSGGSILAFNGSQTATSSPAGRIPTDRALLTQIAIGF